MHELSITEKILKLVLSEAEQNQAKQIIKIKIKIGEMSGLVPDCIKTYFALIAMGTIAAGAELVFTTSRARLFCRFCNREYQKSARDFNCPSCGGLGFPLENGPECLVESIEVD